MQKISLTRTLLLTTALVASSSLLATDARAESSLIAGQPITPLGVMGLSQAGALELPGLADATYWHAKGRGYGKHYGRGGSYRYIPRHRYRRDYRYYRKPRPRDFETEEFNASNAAVQSKAQFAYAKGADGSSVTVGVVDEQFDINHVDLRDNIVDFQDFTADQRRAADDADSITSAVFDLANEALITDHGTTVTGVIAATRNGEGVQGVAPEASILAIRTDTIGVEEFTSDGLDESSAEELEEILIEGSTTFIISDGEDVELLEADEENAGAVAAGVVAAVSAGQLRLFSASAGFGDDEKNAAGIDYATDNGADIINLSQGGPEQDDPSREAIQRATENGVIVVASAGNSAGANPEFPARLAADPAFNGLVLAVGAVDAGNNITDFSERCGVAKENCLVALGNEVDTTGIGDKFVKESGTSFSAPTVSGGLALLLDLFPTLYPEEAVQLVLRTADDLGEEGVDEIFGHGALNLKRAVKPVGVARLPTGKNIRGKVAFLSRSKLGLGGAFGNAFAKAGALKNGFFLDEFRRPFNADLSQQVVAQDRSINFEGVLGGSDIETQTFVNPDGYQVTLAVRDNGHDAVFDTPLAAFGSAQEAYDQENRLQSLRLSGELASGLEISSGVNLTAGQQLTVDPASEATGGLFLFESDAVNPQHGFLGRGNGLSLTQDLTEATSLTLGILTAGEQLGDRSGKGTTTQADLNHRFENGAALGFSASFTQESEGFLGSEAGGAFADKSETLSQFYTLSGSLPVIADIEAFGSSTLGISDLSGVNGGLLADLDRTTSSAFALGLVKKGVIDSEDRIGIRFSQPLRIEGGANATLSVPTSVNADGSINQTSETINLQPSGREFNLQLAYTRRLAEALNVTNYALARTEPGHDQDAKPDFGVGMRVNWNF